jgi:hypothetical protein
MLAAVIPFTPRYSPIVPRPRAARVPQKGENSTRRRISRAFPRSPDPRNLVAGSQRRPTVPTIVDQTFTLSASKTSRRGSRRRRSRLTVCPSVDSAGIFVVASRHHSVNESGSTQPDQTMEVFDDPGSALGRRQ